MKPSVLALSLISLMFFSFQAEAQHLTQLGERLSSCKNLENDDFLITYNDALNPEAKSKMQSDQLRTAIVDADNCFRVGTELKLVLENDDFPFLGRGLVEEMKIVRKDQLLTDSLNEFSHNSTRSYIAANPARRYAIIRFKVTEKIEAAYVNEKYQRLPSCFPAYSDWEAMPVDEKLHADIRSKKVRAQIWNGTYNCYKVGIFTEMYLKRERRDEKDAKKERQQEPEQESLGYIVPTELFLVHYTNLEQKHADLLGENLADLKQTMEKKKEIDGGWVTMVHFNYEAIHPKDLPEDDEDSSTAD